MSAPWRLAPLARVRAVERDLARRGLADAAREQAACGARRAALAEALAASTAPVAEADASLAGGLRQLAWFEARRARAAAALRERLAAAEVELARAAEGWERARTALQGAARQREVVERFRGRWERGRLREVDRAAEAEVDDRAQLDR